MNYLDADGYIKYDVTEEPGIDLFAIVLQQDQIYATVDAWVVELDRVIDKGVPYVRGGTNDKGYDCATYPSYTLKKISGGKIKCETSVPSMLKNERNAFLFIVRLSDYSLDELPEGCIFIRPNNSGITDRSGNVMEGHSAPWFGLGPNGLPFFRQAVGSNEGIVGKESSLSYYVYAAFPKGLGLSKKDKVKYTITKSPIVSVIMGALLGVAARVSSR